MTFTTSNPRDTEACTPEGRSDSPRRPCHSADDAVLKWALQHLRPVDDPTNRSSGEG